MKIATVHWKGRRVVAAEQGGRWLNVSRLAHEFALPLRPGKVVAIGRNYKAHVAEFDNKMPGDIIATGTPEGVSPIHPGDLVEIEIPGIGILRNSVVSG